MPIPTLKGTRVNLRRVRLADAEDILAYATDREVSRWVPTIPHPYKPEDAAAYIRRTWVANRKFGSYMYGIENAETGRIIGGIAMYNISKDHRSAEIGYALTRKFWRQGFTADAIRVIVNFAFEKLKLNRIYATVIEPNTASAELLRKLGWTYEGTLRDGMRVRGRYYDVLVFGILKKDL